MRGNAVKDKLKGGGTAFGTMIFEFDSPGLPTILANAGADYVIYDMEHSGLSVTDIKRQIAYCRGLDLVPLVRPGKKTYAECARLLDIGAMGLMLPMVETREEAEAIASWVRYPPHGVRGAIFGGAHDDYTGGDVAAKIKAADARTMVIVLIETKKGLENVEEILSVDGIDAAHLGQFDLSLSMGIPAAFDRPEFQAAIDRLLAACEKTGKIPACMATDVATAKEWMGRGFRMVGYSFDIALLGGALRQGLDSLKS